MKSVRILLLLVLAGGLGAGYWLFARLATVGIAQPERGDAAEIVYATGVVEPRTWAKVTPLLRERIVELCDCEGAKVERGTVLARLDSRQAEATLAELKAREKLAAADHDRLTQLAERSAASQQALDRARSDVTQARAQVARLESYVLRAPMAGVVLRQDGEVGEIAEPGTILFWVGEPRPLRIVADVNEEDIPQVSVGQRALVRGDAFPDRGLAAVVDAITPKGDPVAKTYRVYLALPGDTPLMIGMTVEVNVVVRVSAKALLVPAAALSGDALFVVEGERARRRAVVTGIRGTAAVEVLSGLAEDARVVTPYPDGLDDGARVRVGGG